MSKGKDKVIVLLDMHAILHRGYHALADFRTSKGEPTGALFGFMTMLIKLLTDVPAHAIVACFDLPGKTYRHDAYEEYKAGRKKMDDELSVQIAKSRILLDALKIPIVECPGFEADDMLGTLSNFLKGAKDIKVVIASGDMDTLQLVFKDKVRVYTLKKGIQDTIIYDESAVFERFGFGPELIPDYKGLRGDPSDNIIGIKGVGEKTATTLISNFGSLENIYDKLEKDEDAFRALGISERMIGMLKEGKEEAMFSKMLATIRKDAPIKYDIPEKTWTENIDKEKLSEIFAELEFRTMEARLSKIIGESVGGASIEMSQEEEKDLGLMLWLVDSNITNPKKADIEGFTKAKSTEEARAILVKLMKERGVFGIYENIEKPLMPVIEKMQKTGVKVDIDYLTKLKTEYEIKTSDLEKKMHDMAGTDFNPRSPKQVGEVLFEKLGLKAPGQKKTSGGAKSTKESELQKMIEMHPIIPLLLEYREISKLLSTYIDVLLSVADSKNRIHAIFNQTGTTTGRLSSEQPNLQNIPARTDDGVNIRKAFVAEEENVFVALDYSQIELRIAAFLSGDKVLVDIFANNRDIHTEVASKIFHVPAEMVDKEMRRKAKVINFGIIYGMGVQALRQNLKCDRKEAQLFYDEYFKAFSGLAEYIDKIKLEASRKGFTETFFGRRRYFGGFSSPLPFVRAEAERQAINAPIQGTQADIIKMAMVEADKMLEDKGWQQKASLVLQVHDELVFEVNESVADELALAVMKIMKNILPKEKTMGIELAVHASKGRDLGNMIDIKI